MFVCCIGRGLFLGAESSRISPSINVRLGGIFVLEGFNAVVVICFPCSLSKYGGMLVLSVLRTDCPCVLFLF